MCFSSVILGEGTSGERGKKTLKGSVEEKVVVFRSLLDGKSVEWRQGRKENNLKVGELKPVLLK